MQCDVMKPACCPATLCARAGCRPSDLDSTCPALVFHCLESEHEPPLILFASTPDAHDCREPGERNIGGTVLSNVAHLLLTGCVRIQELDGMRTT